MKATLSKTPSMRWTDKNGNIHIVKDHDKDFHNVKSYLIDTFFHILWIRTNAKDYERWTEAMQRYYNMDKIQDYFAWYMDGGKEYIAQVDENGKVGQILIEL